MPSERSLRIYKIKLGKAYDLKEPPKGLFFSQVSNWVTNCKNIQHPCFPMGSLPPPGLQTDFPRDLSKKRDRDRSRIGSDSSLQNEENLASPLNHVSDLDRVRDKVGAVEICLRV